MANTYLEKTYSSNGNRRTMTFSFWMKISALDTNMYPISIYDSSTAYQADIRHSSANQLRMYATDTAGTPRLHLLTNRLFRDTSAWYHIVWEVDTTQATASDRVKLYVNGVQETSFGTETYPPQNTDLRWNGDNSADQGGVTQIGAINAGGNFDGSMSHFHFIDGTAYDADTFGETDATTGIWKPKTAPSVTYGTNGFFLKFENSGAFGTDSSGNANNFTVNGTMTQTIDTPSNVFATLNPNYQSTFDATSRAILTNENTKWTGTSNVTSQNGILSTLGASSGKWYLEAKWVGTSDATIGVAKEDFGMMTAGTGGLQSAGWYGMNTNISATGGSGMAWYTNNSATGDRGNTISTNDIIMMAIDIDNSKLYFGKNGTWEESGDPTSGATGTGATSTLANDTTYLVACANYGYAIANSWEFNFGNGYFGTTAVSSAQNPDDGIGIFEYDVPAGYRALCTKSINAEEYN